MLKSYFLRCFLLALFLCLGAANVPAQEPEMIAPPIPSVLPSPPPAADALPPPPPLTWESLTPRDSGDESGPTLTVSAQPPQTDTSIAPPPPPALENPMLNEPDPAEIELAKPDVEIWREQSEWPQIPVRLPTQLDQAYIAGTGPVVLRVEFNSLAVGKRVYVRAGNGVTIGTSATPRIISSNGTKGECLVSAQLDANFTRSHIIFYCEGVKTVLPLVRASLARVEQNEEETGGGQ